MGPSVSRVPAPRPQPSSSFVGLYVAFLPEPENAVQNKKFASTNLLCSTRSRRITHHAGSTVEGQAEKEENHAAESSILMTELNRVLKEIHQSSKSVTWRIPKYIVSAFVDAVEEADQYFNLKKYLREECPFVKYDSSEDHIYDRIVEVQRHQNEFNMLCEEIVKHAVNACISELKAEHTIHREYEYKMYLRNCNSIKWDKNSSLPEIVESQGLHKKFPDLSVTDIEEGLKWYIMHSSRSCTSVHKFLKISYQDQLERLRQIKLRSLLEDKEEDLYVVSYPVYKLVFRARQKGYVMDPNPEVEVAKIINKDHRFSHEFLMSGPMENLSSQARTVIVHNVSLNASVQDIRQLFSISGDIEHAKMESGDKSQTAFVTFKYFEGAESALVILDPTILDLPVSITPTIDYQQRRAISTYLMSKDVEAPNSDVPAMKFKNCEYPSSSLDEARLIRYSQLLSKFAAA